MTTEKNTYNYYKKVEKDWNEVLAWYQCFNGIDVDWDFDEYTLAQRDAFCSRDIASKEDFYEARQYAFSI